MAIDCPYCGEPKMASGLRGHVVTMNDEAHGPLGTVPDDFEEPEQARPIVSSSTDASESELKGEGGLVSRLRKRLG
jgi:hypothetical protein